MITVVISSFFKIQFWFFQLGNRFLREKKTQIKQQIHNKLIRKNWIHVRITSFFRICLCYDKIHTNIFESRGRTAGISELHIIQSIMQNVKTFSTGSSHMTNFTQYPETPIRIWVTSSFSNVYSWYPRNFVSLWAKWWAWTQDFNVGKPSI